MKYLSGEARARVRAFDAIVEKNHQALTHPKVRAVLGTYAATLAGINNQLFMPNIRGTSIRLPKAHQMDNHAALLPLLTDDPARGLQYTPTMFLPGAAQLDRTRQRVESNNSDLSVAQARQTVANAMMFFRTDRAQASLDEHLQEVTQKREQGLFPPSATLGSYVRMDDERDILYGRQLIVVPAELAGFSVPALGNIVAHEELHVDDNDTRTYASLSEEGFGIQKELRGYHVGALILGCLAEDILESDRPVTESTLLIETIRQRSKQGTDEPPFSVNEAISAYFGVSE